MAYQFKIQLRGVTKPPVWRRIIVPEEFTFQEFHEVIQLVFEWNDYHLYQFSPSGYGSNPVIALPAEDEWEKPELNAKKTRLNQVFTREKQRYVYIYDFGDDWTHQIELEKLVPDDSKIPVCLAGKGACPPEDCGGAWGYEELKIILADPTHEDHGEMKEWLGLEEGDEWDAGEFDVEEVNERLIATFEKGTGPNL